MTRTAVALRWAGIVVLLVAAIVLAVTVGVPDLASVRARADALGWEAAPLYAALYAVVSLSPLPKTVFTLGAGAVFGLAVGLPVVFSGAVVGSVLGFALGRLLGQDLLHRYAGRTVERVDAQLRRYGVWAVLVLRLVPFVPFTALNYVAGVTAVRRRDFLLGTAVGILPATTATVALGAYGSNPTSWPFVLAAGALILLTVGGVVWTRRRPTAAPSEGEQQQA